MDKLIRFRPHHLLCMLTYIGKGYTEKFTHNYNRIIDDINNGNNEILLIDGADDICAPRLCDKDDITCHCLDAKIKETDAKALNDLKKVAGFEHIAVGKTLKLTESLIKSLRTAYKSNSIRTACIGCEWKNLCDGIVRDNFKGTKLK